MSVDWLLSMLTPLVMSSIPILAAWILSRIYQHSVGIYASRREIKDIQQFRVAVQNLEDVPLEVRLELEISLLDTSSRFFYDGGKAVQVYAGPISYYVDANASRSTICVAIDSLPAHDIWVVVCRAETGARGLRVHLHELQGDQKSARKHRWLNRLKNHELELDANVEHKRSGADRTPTPIFAIGVILLCLCLYLFPIVAPAQSLVPFGDLFTNLGKEDIAPILILIGAGILMYFGLRRDVAPLAQGYQDATISRMLRPPDSSTNN